jgi:TetR/AcrR family transcriptional regulator
MIEELNAEEKILAAAKNVFLKKGYDGARMQAIADEAGINKAMLHYYFRNKDLLFERVFKELLRKLVPNINQIVTNPDLDVFQKIEQFVHTYIDFLLQNPDVPMFILGEVSKREAILQKVILSQEADNQAPQVPVFLMQLMEESAKGKIKPVNPFHFIINMLSMCVFPFAAKTMISTMLKMKEDDFNLFIQERKKEIVLFLHTAIKP